MKVRLAWNLLRRTALAFAAVALVYSLATAALGLAAAVFSFAPTATLAAARHSREVAAMMGVLPDPVAVFFLAFAMLGRAWKV